LHNPEVEPICRRYLELRYRMMPYLYSVVRESHETGLPIMRALWLQHAADPQAVVGATEYLWGRDILVAPVVERGAAKRDLYLPRGQWFDFWNESPVEGGRQISRPVDLGTIPLYVRAGAILPFGPLKQYTAQPAAGPTELVIYPGADGSFTLYEDDGVSYGFKRGEFSRLRLEWNNRSRTLSISPDRGSRSARPREFSVRLAPGTDTRTLSFRGSRMQLQIPE
jgi:alpha-glucosidase/alpha-D-xyloside xylohydrolase